MYVYIRLLLPPNPSLEFENVEDSSGEVTNEEHGRDADKDGEEAPLGAVGHLKAETRARWETTIIILQGGPSGCSLGFVDNKTEIEFYVL